MITVNIGKECSGKSYQSLIDFAAKHSDTFYLVDQFHIPEENNIFLLKVKSFLKKQMQTLEWPGTKLVGDKVASASVMYYNVNKESIRLISQTCSSLYEWSRWHQPPLPEDLGFVRADGSVLLATISHEKDAWLELERAEFDEFMSIVTNVGIAILDEQE